MDVVEIQAAYYMVAATGVLVAALYIYNMRNAERDRRKQSILQKLPTFNKEYYEDFS